MEAIKLIGTSHDGILTIAVPEEFNEKELEVMIISSKGKKNENEEKIKKKQKDKRAEKFMKLFGSAKHPDFPMTKYDTYDQ